jgi:hypothetical protein
MVAIDLDHLPAGSVGDSSQFPLLVSCRLIHRRNPEVHHRAFHGLFFVAYLEAARESQALCGFLILDFGGVFCIGRLMRWKTLESGRLPDGKVPVVSEPDEGGAWTGAEMLGKPTPRLAPPS